CRLGTRPRSRRTDHSALATTERYSQIRLRSSAGHPLPLRAPSVLTLHTRHLHSKQPVQNYCDGFSFPQPVTKKRPPKISSMPIMRRNDTASPKSHAPSAGVSANANATNGYARESGVKVNIHTQKTESAP